MRCLVIGLMIDTTSLAKDTAEFLSGRRSQPLLDDYAVPGYLLALCGSPVGLAVLTKRGRNCGRNCGRIVHALRLDCKKRFLFDCHACEAITLIGAASICAGVAIVMMFKPR